jgi:hypothetical protein
MNDQLDTQEGVLQQDPPSKKLYDFMVGRKVYSKSYDDFKTQFSSPEKIEKLHSFLSNSQNEEGGKLYSKSINEFNDQFFQDVKKKEPSQSNSFGFPSALQYPKVDANTKIPVQEVEQEQPITDIIGTSKNIKDLGGKGEWTGEDMEGGGGIFKHDEAALASSKDLNKKIINQTGIDSKEIYNLTKNLVLTPEQQSQYNEDIATNPQGAVRRLSSVNWRQSFLKKAEDEWKKAEANNDHVRQKQIEDAVNNTHQLPVVQDYGSMRKKIADETVAIRTIFDEPDEYQNNLSKEASIVYGTHILPHVGNDGNWYKSTYDNKASNMGVMDKSLKEGSAGINKYQSIFLDYLQDLKPTGDKSYEVYKGLLTPLKDRDDKGAFEGLGYEYRQKEAEEAGINLAYNAALELRNEAFKKGDNKGVDILNAEIAKLKNDSETIDDRYLKIKRHEAEINAIDINGNPSNEVARVWNKAAIATGNMALGVYDMLTLPFMDETSQNNRLMGLYGYKKSMEEVTHDPQSTEQQPQYDLEISDEMQKKVDEIKKSDIPFEEKNTKIAQLSYDNPNDFKKVAPTRATNWTVRSIWNGVSNLGATLVPYIIGSSLTGGASAAGGISGFATEVTVAALPMVSEGIQAAVEEGSANPLGVGVRSSFVTALFIAGMGTVKEIRSFAEGNKNPVLKDMIAKMSDKELEAGIKMASKSTAAQSFKVVVDKVKKAALSAPKISATLSAAGTVNDVLDNRPISVEEKLTSLGIETFKMFTFEMLTGLGGAFIRKEKPNDLHKLSIFETGRNPEAAITEIDRQFEKGTLTKIEHTELKKNIEMAKKVYENTPKVNAKGKELSDKETRELMYLKLREAKLEDFMSKDIPKELQDKTEAELMKVQDEIDKVYKGTFISNIILDENQKDISSIIKDTRERKELGAYSFIEKDEDLLREVAMQAQNVQQDGSVSKLQTDNQAYKSAVNGLGVNGKAIVDVAIAKFPKETLVKEEPIPEPPAELPAEVPKTPEEQTKELEMQRDEDIELLNKPKTVSLLSADTIGKLPAVEQAEIKKIQNERNELKSIIDCLWKRKI